MPQIVTCHKLPERSFFFRGKQFPFCARCTGVYLGHVFALGLFWFIRPAWWIVLLLLIPMFVDWIIQYKEVLPSTNVRRLITGALGGYSILTTGGYILVSLIRIFSSFFS